MKLPIHLLSENFVVSKQITEETAFEICEVDARELLCPERLDLAAKLAYIETKENNADMGFAKEVYEKHIEAFSEGSFVEPGDREKTSFGKYIEVFDELIESFKKGGFDDKKSLIPVGQNNVILDGAHRTACAIYFKEKVKIIRFPELEVKFDYFYFQSRRLREELIEYMALIYAKYAVKNIYMACIWPVAAKEKRELAIGRIEKEHRIIFKTEKNLLQNGLRNFMLQIYGEQSWIGTPESHFSGVMGKVNACFKPGVSTGIVFFEDGNLSEILQMKDEIREIFKIEKHAIHISDSNLETRLMANLLFNENSIVSLNYGKPDTFPEDYRAFLKHGVSDRFDKEATLSYFGIKKAERLVVEEVMYDEWNPRTYFVFGDVKLPTLEIIKPSLQKDSVYVAVKNILRQSGTTSRMKRELEYRRIKLIWEAQKIVLKCKQMAMRITTKMGVYDLLHKIHDDVRKRDR